MRVELIEPHGMCAGVSSAIAKALKLKDVYCLHALVHNEIVIGELKALGFKFVESVEEIPEGETVVFSAHGVSPAVRALAAKRRLKTVDLTCPFVEKVHRAASAFAKRGLPVVVLGDPRHVEAKGIAGEGAEVFVLRPGERVSACPFPAGAKIGVVSQTTMNADEAAAAVAALKERYQVETMAEVCQATLKRQEAVKAFVAAHPAERTAVLVLGSATSSNTKRLKEVATAMGAKAAIASSLAELSQLDFGDTEVLGVTSGASTPERFFMEAVKALRKTPEHVAIIMDGNGRWAKSRGKLRNEGHREGAKTLEKVLKWCGDRGVKTLTVYAFSTENWKRPAAEVEGLMKLLGFYLKHEFARFVKDQIRFRVIGRRQDLPAALLKEVETLERKTAGFERQLIVALSYGGRAEIVDAVNAAVKRGEPVTEESFREFLYAPDLPDPDLIIRTSGEKRVSNFLLWESAYSEYHFTEVLWPDFSEADLDRAFADYATRDRRLGGR